MKKLGILLSLVGVFATMEAAHAGDNVYGTITWSTSVPEGLVLLVAGGVASDCGTNVTMLVPEANKTMITNALMAVSLGKTVRVFTNGATAAPNHCKVTQVHVDF